MGLLRTSTVFSDLVHGGIARARMLGACTLFGRITATKEQGIREFPIRLQIATAIRGMSVEQLAAADVERPGPLDIC